jgi:hypothetical protein
LYGRVYLSTSPSLSLQGEPSLLDKERGKDIKKEGLNPSLTPYGI